jgi:probable O-glycosylation ligase (exosortase A-associated)
MRDLFISLAVFGSLPLILRKPFFGVLVWAWLGLMNPHRLCFGFATTMPFAQIVALALVAALIIRREPMRIPSIALTWLLGFWWFWLFVTTLTAFYPELAWIGWNRAWKILFSTFIIMSLLVTRERIDALVWVIVFSIGIYGVKGGIFTLLGGGAHHVVGPIGSFIAGNNELGLAMVMTVPLLRYLHLTSGNELVRMGLLAVMGLTVFAILGTQSRGSLVGLLAMIVLLAWKSRNKATLLLLLALALPAAFMFMPESWYSRMDTIQSYELDPSALGRINAWWTAWYVALDHPFLGGGFDMFRLSTFMQYAPNPRDAHDVHSIYFQALGEHGFVGLFTFLAIGLSALMTLNRIVRFAKRHGSLVWMRDLASMLYVCLIGYATNGLFLGLSMFDYYYTVLAITVGLAGLIDRYARDGAPPVGETPAAVADATAKRQFGSGMGPAVPRKRRRFVQGLVNWYQKL